MDSWAMQKHLVEIVIVTYSRDFAPTIKLIEQLRSKSYLYEDIKIHVIVNDNNANLNQFSKLAKPYNVSIHHSVNFNVHNDSAAGWLTQQQLKLAIADHIQTPWYLIIDGDQTLWDSVESIEESDWFTFDKAYCKVTTMEELKTNHYPLLYVFANIAQKINVNLDEIEYMLIDKPPTMMHTDTVRRLIREIGTSEILKAQATEFSLYWLYLVKQKIEWILYEPTYFPYFNKIHEIIETPKS